jgi:hypothetical protein
MQPGTGVRNGVGYVTRPDSIRFVRSDAPRGERLLVQPLNECFELIPLIIPQGGTLTQPCQHLLDRISMRATMFHVKLQVGLGNLPTLRRR